VTAVKVRNVDIIDNAMQPYS